EEAIAHFEQLLELDPTNRSANYLTAISYLALYHPGSEAPKDEEYAERGIAAFEKTQKFYLGFLDATGNKDKAIAYLEGQLKQRPNELALINQIAVLYQKK